MNITLQSITEENFLDAFNLKLKKEQESFVSHPVRSLAQAYVYRDQCQPFGIYHEDIMVGYVMVIYDYDIPEYDIWHMMIDEAQQDKGYGKAAMQKVLEYIKTKPFGTSNRIALTCNTENAPLCTSIPSSALRPQVQSMTMKSSSCSPSKTNLLNQILCIEKEKTCTELAPAHAFSFLFTFSGYTCGLSGPRHFRCEFRTRAV